MLCLISLRKQGAAVPLQLSATTTTPALLVFVFVFGGGGVFVFEVGIISASLFVLADMCETIETHFRRLNAEALAHLPSCRQDHAKELEHRLIPYRWSVVRAAGKGLADDNRQLATQARIWNHRFIS